MADQSRPVVTGYPTTTGYPHSQPNGYSTTTTTATTAYPYAAPPPQSTYYNPNPNPNPYYPQPYPDPRATFLRRLFSILIASFIIAGTIAFIIWLILRPQIPQFQVDSLTLSNFNLSTSSSSLITGNWDVHFTVRNPNHKITLSYDHVEASVCYKDEYLSKTTVPPFVQGTRNQTTVRATIAAVSAYVEKWVADNINSDRTGGGRVNFNVRMLARVRLKAGIWRARRRYLSVYCGDLLLGISGNDAGGTLTGPPRICRVAL